MSTSTRRTACSLITADEISALLAAPIGKPAEQNSADKTSCLYPPADASSSAQVAIEIDWKHGKAPSQERQLVDAFGGSAAGQQVAHSIQLGDEAAYSMAGVLSIRTGETLATIELPMRDDSEAKAVAIGTLLLKRLSGRTGTAGTVSADPAPEAPSASPAAQSPTSALQFVGDGLSAGEECPNVANGPNEAESALVPLKVGLTLSHIWNGGDDDYDHECLVQVVAVTSSYVDVTQSCPRGADRHNLSMKRRICRGDFRDSYFYRTETSLKGPLVVTPATMFSLSTRSLHELKAAGATRHRYFEINDDWRSSAQALDRDLDAVLRAGLSAREPYSIIVNGQVVELPTVAAISGGGRTALITAKVLDDERFPLVLDYAIPDISLKIRYTKISYPTSGELEKHLAVEKRVDLYGIYFDSGSDGLRAESTPVLEEIAGVLSKNTDWKLNIGGHTDNVGGDAPNMELSRKRALAVKSALVERYDIAASRLTTGGFGASRPQASNDTTEGRARNRRVELTRQ